VAAAIVVHRDVTLTPDPADPAARSLAGLITELQALVARNSIGPDAIVGSIAGNASGYRLTLTKPD
jgi:hypothetical protein